MDLNRVESAIIACGRGMGSEWAQDQIHALALVDHRNKLGNALIHLLDHPNGANCRIVGDRLAAMLVKFNIVPSRDSVDISQLAIEWYLTKNCPACDGAGCNTEQVPCVICQGKGHKPKPAALERALALMEASIEWADSQMGHSLSNAYYKPRTAVSDARMEDSQTYGWVTQPVFIE